MKKAVKLLQKKESEAKTGGSMNKFKQIQDLCAQHL